MKHSDVHYTNIPIGKPIANTQAYILDEDNHVMGIGVSGELVIGGVNVTEGYLNRPELTQENLSTTHLAKANYIVQEI